MKAFPKTLKSNLWIAAFVLLTALGLFLMVRGRMPAVRMEPLIQGDLTTAIYGSAQLKTDRAFDLKLGTVARISKILKSAGQRVAQGETIVQFDNLPPFRAPIAGILTAINFRNGETAFAQTTVLSIVDATDFYLEMSLDQKSIRYVREGQSARISFEGYRDLKFEGKVRSTFSNNNIFYAVIELGKADSSFLPGMSADVAIVTETRKNVLLAPVGALKDGKLLVKRKGPPQEIPVAVGGNDGAFAEVASQEIRPGDLVVIRSSLPVPPVGGAK